MARDILLQICRQLEPGSDGWWEEFVLPHRADLTITACLMMIQRDPMTREGRRTRPIAWEASCLEEICGACSMLVNGVPRQACSTLVDGLKQPIRLEPLKKFPLVRDLLVDRSRMFEELKTIQAWVPGVRLDDTGPGPRIAPELQQVQYALSRCMTCGVCLEACPQVNRRSAFIGPAAIGQAWRFNLHALGAEAAEARLRTLTGSGGIDDCGSAQTCVEACPMKLPLTESIAALNRDLTRLALRDLWRKWRMIWRSRREMTGSEG